MIIFINGSINSGKTTIANILAKKISNSAVVEIDALRDMIGEMPLEQSIPINLENAVSLIKNFSKRNLNVIVPYPLSQKNYDYLTNELKDLDTKIYTFTLSPKLEKVLMNRGNRELSEEEQKRIQYHYSVGINNPSFGEVIDNSDQTPDETTDYICSKINV